MYPTPDVNAALQALRDALGAVPGVQTSRVGLEANLSPADYPIVRITPSRITPGATMARRKVEALIYFGQPVHEFDAGGIDGQYAQLLAMEAALVDAIYTHGGQWIETIADEDRVEGYKLMALRVELQA